MQKFTLDRAGADLSGAEAGVFLLLSVVLFMAGCGGGTTSSSSSSTPPSSGPATLQSITINPSNASVAPGTTQAFTATGNYSDGSTKDLTLSAQWVCLGTTAATVSSTSPTQGVATAVSPGTAVVTASFSGVSNNAMLNITSATVSSLAVAPAAQTIGYLNQQQFAATATFSDGTTQDVTNLADWSFQGSGPFITSNSGLAIGSSLGTSTVQASFGSESNFSQTPPPALTVDLSNLVSIVVLPANPSIANLTKLDFSVLGTFTDGSTRDVTSLAQWTFSDPTIATFGTSSTTTNEVTAKEVGGTTVSASVGTMNASTSLTVTGATLQSIALTPSNATIAPPTELNFVAIGTFSDTTTQDLTSSITWSVLNPLSNPSAASIDSKGVVTAAGQGTVTVSAVSSAKLGSILGSTQLNVSGATLSSISVTPATVVIAPGGTLSFSATATFSDGSTQDITNMAKWTSSTKTVATVASASSAATTGQGIGQSTITAAFGGLSGTATMVVASPKQITLAVTPATPQIAAQTSTQLTATGTFVDGSTQDLTSVVNWSSSAPATATVGYQTGLVFGLAAGQSTITASLGSSTATTQLTVTNATASSITISPAIPSFALGTSQHFTATGHFSDRSTRTLSNVNWSSSTAGVAVVDSSGAASATGTGASRLVPPLVE